MNNISRNPVNSLGYNFIPAEYIPKGKNEYYLRDLQNKNGIHYRGLTAYEIEVLVRNRNTSDNWNNILVSDAFTPERVQDCKFFGLVRIGKLEAYYLEFNNLRRPVGLYNSTIISCDFGDNVVIDNVNYISHYITGNEVIIVNVNEMATTDYAKFGNGILKEGESESIRIWLELCNENGGRKIIPFDGMLPGDAYLWTRYRDDRELQEHFRLFTQKCTDSRRGYYGLVGDRTVIKNCKILKDVNIGTDAYLKGANKIKNITVNSSAEANTQIGEGCELVNGIIGYGCRIFYGVKAVRFFMASHSQLKYGARLINSYLGNNSTISCCEVLNSLIFPSHEQHHNNSFLCAALLQGQTNMAAGATIGSNHNSRGADGELVAGRGFWPGLCVSLKHNSRFASFAILAKGDYPAELNIPFPFSLISNDVSRDTLLIMPGYWFFHNMYALARNSWKYMDRDQRTEKLQDIEFNFLAPDTINEMLRSLDIMCMLVGKAASAKSASEKKPGTEELKALGKKLLESKDPSISKLEVHGEGFENSRRKVKILKITRCYHLYKELIIFYTVQQLLHSMGNDKAHKLPDLIKSLPAKPKLAQWKNIGGQLIPEAEIEKMITGIKQGKIKSWKDVHSFYTQQAVKYPHEKLSHALGVLEQLQGYPVSKMKPSDWISLLRASITTKEWMVSSISESRAKDYQNPFRKMVYENEKEMETILGSLDDNSFIKMEQQELKKYRKRIQDVTGGELSPKKQLVK